jgi:imidazolonepropionase-like amidohydrolase
LPRGYGDALDIQPSRNSLPVSSTKTSSSVGGRVDSASSEAIKAAGGRLDEMVVRDVDDLKVVMGNDSTYGNQIPWERPTSFYYRQPTTRMGVVWLLRQALFNVRQAVKLGTALSPTQRAIADALQGKMPVEVALRSAVDIETTFTVADEFGLRNLVFSECTEGYKMAAEIARRKVPAILGPFYYYPNDWPQYSEGWDVSWNNAGLLSKAGVRIALASNDPNGPADLRLSAMLAARHGLPPEEALRAVTAGPAEMLGIADRVGSLAKGKDADLVILSGDPLKPTTLVEKVIVSGRVVFDAESGASADGKG